MSVAAATAIDCARCPVDAALWLARTFTGGCGLMVRAPGREDHAHHVAVEFVHPVVAGARSLPAAAAGHGEPAPFATSPGPPTAGRWRHLLIGPPDGGPIDLSLPADDGDAAVMTGYHLLWELVQVALEHPGLVGGGPTRSTDTVHPDASHPDTLSPGASHPDNGHHPDDSHLDGNDPDGGQSHGGDSTGFLYPFLDAAEHDEAGLRASLESSAAAKRAESERLAAEAVADNRQALDAAAALVNGAVAAGRRVLTMGNGGSATDAARLVRLLRARGAEAVSLADDYAVISALANDLGAEAVFARQIEALGAPGDVLIGCSTSGASPNLLAAFGRARAAGLRTVGISGYRGGAFAGPDGAEVCLAVASDSVHRIQEAEAALTAELCRRIEPAPGAGGAQPEATKGLTAELCRRIEPARPGPAPRRRP